jgi:hypothetical protein
MTEAEAAVRRLAEAREAADAFARALSPPDLAAAQAATAAGAWDAGQDQLSDLAGQAVAKGLVLDLVGMPRLVGARGAMWAVLSKPGAPKPLGDLFLLLAEQDGWQLVGLTKVRGQVALYLRGEIAAAGAPTDLPASPAAEGWGAAWLTTREGGPAALIHAAASADGGSVARSVAVPGTTRSAVQLDLTTATGPSTVWVVLDDGAPIDARPRRLRFERLLKGLELPWPREGD